MTPEMIEKFVGNGDNFVNPVRIHFKERASIDGFFVRGQDYKELKSKNFWRVVKADRASLWAQTKNLDLTRLYNGISFTKISGNS